MGLSFDFVPFTKRETPESARVYSHFPEEFRSRFIKIIRPHFGSTDVKRVYNEYHMEFSGGDEYFEVYSDGSMSSPVPSHEDFIMEGDDESLIDYFEYILNYLWETYRNEDVLKVDSRVRRALREERVLFRLSPNREFVIEIENHSHASFDPSAHEPIKFEFIGSEPMVQADNDLRVLGFDSKWAPAVDHYDSAWEYYQEGIFNSSIPEELAKAIESACFTICKEEQNWVAEGAGLGRCLDEMKNQGLFEPNEELYPEWERIATGLKLSAQKAAGDKHGHEEVNQHYSLMLLHQSAAFLTYVINRYEDLYE